MHCKHYSLEVGARKGCTSTEIPGGGPGAVQEQKGEMVLWLCAVFVSSRVGYLPHDCGNPASLFINNSPSSD